jgi:CBS domain-containing protein
MPKAFDITNPPFDRLMPGEAETLRAALDIGYFSPGEAIIGRDAPAEALYVVIKGIVEERNEADLLALLGPKDGTLRLVDARQGRRTVPASAGVSGCQ